MRLNASFVLAGWLLVVPLPLEAHHSQSSFWLTDQTASVEGVLKEVHIINPHVQIVVEVTGPNGEKSDWFITGAKNASAMIRAGWTDDTLTPGMRVSLDGAPSRRKGAKALLAGDVTILSTGRVLDFSNDSPPNLE